MVASGSQPGFMSLLSILYFIRSVVSAWAMQSTTIQDQEPHLLPVNKYLLNSSGQKDVICQLNWDDLSFSAKISTVYIVHDTQHFSI